MPVRAILASLSLLTPSAQAAEVVWLGPVSDAQRTRVEAIDGYEGTLDPWAFRSDSADDGTADDAAWDQLATTLQDVRPYELKLDGELVIMADLQVPIDALSVMRDEADRNALFRALAYQGFAVNRFYAGALGSDPEAGPWRATVAEQVVERPWRDAAALDPNREVTPYEIAEAPQRVAYEGVRRIVADALPGGLRVEGIPEGAVVMVDGTTRDLSIGTLRIAAGRHYVHVQKGDRILQRWTVDLEPAGSEVLSVTLTDDVWQGFVRGLSAETAVPEAFAGPLKARGGEVWFARAGDKVPIVFRVTADSVAPVELPKVGRTGGDDDDSDGLSAAVAVGGGWMSSGDFFLQEFPDAPETRATVNSAALVGGVSVDFDRGIFRVGAGVDAAFTPGEFHYAKFGDARTRVRPYPHLAVGTRYAVVTAGWLFPHHPTAGLRATIPMAGGFEVRADGRIGLGGDRTLTDGDIYTIQPLYTAFASIGWRLSP